jgi:hypothetical protein
MDAGLASLAFWGFLATAVAAGCDGVVLLRAPALRLLSVGS